MNYNEVDGDLIALAKKGTFDVITHGCNCQSIMSAGIAVPMNLHFDCSQFPMELQGRSIEKLGNIDYKSVYFPEDEFPNWEEPFRSNKLIVVNSYTQNYPSVKMKLYHSKSLKFCTEYKI